MDPGTALAIVSLSFHVFGRCVKGFVLLSEAHNLGQDASFLRAMINLEEYRFTQWAKTVGLTGPDATLNPRLNQTLAAKLMGQMLLLLSTNKLKERYQLELVHSRPMNVSTNDRENVTAFAEGILSRAVSEDARGEILARANLVQAKNHLPKRLWWASVDKKKFENLVQDVRAIVDGLWALLDPLQQDEVTQMMKQVLSVVIQVSKDVNGLQDLQATLNSLRNGTRRNAAPLAVAAGLKAARIETQDDEKSKPSSLLSQQAALMTLGSPHNITKAHRNNDLAPLQLHLLTNFVAKTSNPSVGTGLYSGKPVFVEYKTVSPKLKGKLISRVKNLALLLSIPKDPSFLTLHCLGFFEEGDRFAFIYAYPNDSTDGSAAIPAAQPVSLLDILRDSSAPQPSVTVRLNIALSICRTLLTLHTAGWLHKDLRSENILFFPSSAGSTILALLARPYLTGFAFSRFDSPEAISEQPSANSSHDIYRHPQALGEPSTSFKKHMDMYSLGTIMVEIAEWRPLKHVILKCVDVRNPAVNVPLTAIASTSQWLVREKVENGAAAFRMGEVFGRTLTTCLKGGGAVVESDDKSLDLQQIVRDFERCFI
jgi:Prion-inhibition and propagation